jgi:hypothetical protein
MMEKWQKLLDSQLKSAPSGMRCTKVAPAEGWEILSTKCQGYLESTLLEETRQTLALLEDDRLRLRQLLLKTVNELQSILHQAQIFLPDGENLEAVRHSCLFKKKIIS